MHVYHNMQTTSKWYLACVANAHSRRSDLPYCPMAEIRKKFGSRLPNALRNHEKEIAWIHYCLCDLLYPATYLQK